ncbi:MAG: L(+)-tartrate dehydratase subunit beta [Lachnospiraceae bacterium]|nr:L(+)-tartrate dehydratase subunit beta [Lachnospiraceae bacterium]
MKKILTTPITPEQIEDLHTGDTVYLTGMIATCRDSGHHRVLAEGRMPEAFDLQNGAIFHAGPIVRKRDDGTYEMISVGPTTSRRMESAEAAFIEKTGVKLIVGKGGMGENTAAACRKHGAIHCAYPGGCAVLAATQVEEIVRVEWEDLGMPEALWCMRVKEFGPLIVTIDTKGNNLFEENKRIYKKRLEEAGTK